MLPTHESIVPSNNIKYLISPPSLSQKGINSFSLCMPDMVQIVIPSAQTWLVLGPYLD